MIKVFLVAGGIIALGVIRLISSAAKALGYTPADVKQMFCREVQADMVSAPVMTVQKCAKLVRMSMEGKLDEAKKALNRETKNSSEHINGKGIDCAMVACSTNKHI